MAIDRHETLDPVASRRDAWNLQHLMSRGREEGSPIPPLEAYRQSLPWPSSEGESPPSDA